MRASTPASCAPSRSVWPHERKSRRPLHAGRFGRFVKVLLFGKTRSVNRLVEDAAEGFRRAGHDVHIFEYRNNKLKKTLEPLLLSPRLGYPLAAMMARRMRRMAPDLVLAIGPFHWLPVEIFQMLRAVPNRPPLVAWVGDIFGADAASAADLFDLVAYTDSGMQALHHQFGFRSASGFVPLAAERSAVQRVGLEQERIPRLAFVASASPHRRALLSNVPEPVALFGTDWRDATGLQQHPRDGRRIGASELIDIYRTYTGVLNIRHEKNVINGLNQRHFAPYIEGTPVVTDPQQDVESCFDPGLEMLVYRDAEELTALLRELRTNAAMARTVGLAGQRRVLAHHTYGHRLNAIAALVGLRSEHSHHATPLED